MSFSKSKKVVRLELIPEKKDSSQETVISLLGMLVCISDISFMLHHSDRLKAGSIVVSYVSSPIATWTCLITLLSIHLATNHAAVKAVVMDSLNRQRANFVLSTFLETGEILTPEVVSYHERIFEWDGVLRWRGKAPFAKARIGVSLQEMLSTIAPTNHKTGATRDRSSIFQTLVRLHQDENFLLWYSSLHRTVYIVLKRGASAKTQIKAWAVGLRAAHRLTKIDATAATADEILQVIATTLSEMSNQWDNCLAELQAIGWKADIASLETSSGARIRLHSRSVQEQPDKKA